MSNFGDGVIGRFEFYILNFEFSGVILSRMQKYELTLFLDGKTTPAKKKSQREIIEKIIQYFGQHIGG